MAHNEFYLYLVLTSCYKYLPGPVSSGGQKDVWGGGGDCSAVPQLYLPEVSGPNSSGLHTDAFFFLPTIRNKSIGKLS